LSKIALRLKKVCYKVSLCETVSGKVVRHSTNHVKMIGGGQPLLPEIFDQTDRVGAKLLISDLFLFVATQPEHLAKKFS